MTMVQELPKKNRREKLKSARKLSDARDDIIDLFEKGTLPYKGSAFKTKEEESEEESEKQLEEKKLEKIKDDFKNLSNILRMNQRILATNCSKNILILKYLLFSKKII